jgi:hypothetical protein
VVDRERKAYRNWCAYFFYRTIQNNMKNFITLITISTIVITATSCATSKECHTKGYYVSKSVKKVQQRPKQ